jgi:RHS repeat-associated protein
MPGRTFSSSSYRYGFNGKENDNEVEGEGNIYDYGFRIYNPRIAKFLSIDPLTTKFSELTPYQFASNTPLWAVDIDGLEAGLYGSGGMQLSTAEKQSQAVSDWSNSPAEGWMKRGLAAQINYSQSGTNFNESDFNNLTKGGYYGRSFLISLNSWAPSNPGNLKIPNTRQPQTPEASVPNKTGTVKIVQASSESIETVTVTRVQSPHKLSQRILVNESGDVSILGKTKLYITIDDKNHATYYYNKKGGSEGGASIISFQVKKEVADEIRQMAIPQAKAKSYPDRPEISDPNQSKSAFGLPANYIDKLKKGIVNGTGKVETP